LALVLENPQDFVWFKAYFIILFLFSFCDLSCSDHKS
jgi:hypothetical protein